MRLLTTLLLVGALAGIVNAADPAPATPAWIGFHGPNGTGVYPDCKPPTSWNLTTGKNVRWVVPLDGWSQGTPTIADGKVFLMHEPDINHVFPRLQCLDLASGKVLWEDTLDHLPAAIPDEAERAKVYKMAERQNQATTLGAVFEREYLMAKTDDERAAVIASWRKRGFIPSYRSFKGDDNLDEKGLFKGVRVCGDDGKNEQQLKLYLPNDEQRTTNPTLLRYGFWEEIYQANCNYACIGKTFGAPVWCDGAVYVATAGGVFAKYDMDGKRQWLTWSFKPGLANLNSSGHDTCARAPIIAGELFIGTAANNLVAIERNTGKVKFKDNIKSESIATPVVLKVGESNILLTAGPQAYLLPSGQRLQVEGWLSTGMQALVKNDESDVVYFGGLGQHANWNLQYKNPVAVRYVLDGEKLRGTILWSGATNPTTKVVRDAGGTLSLFYNQGRVYCQNGVILDATTGMIVKGGLDQKPSSISKDRAVPATAMLLQSAGNNVYGWLNGSIGVYSSDGNNIADNLFVEPHLTKEQIPIWQGVESTDDYFSSAGGWCKYSLERSVKGRPAKRGMLSYSHPFTFGNDCLVARSLMHLYCFSEGAQLPPTTVPVQTTTTKE